MPWWLPRVLNSQRCSLPCYIATIVEPQKNQCIQCIHSILHTMVEPMYSFYFRYKERLYCFSSEEAKEKFLNDPEAYVATAHLLKVRIALE